MTISQLTRHIADAGAAQDAGVIGSPEAGAPGVTWQVPELWIQNDITSTSSGPVIFTGNRKRDNYSDIRKFWLENAVVSLDPDNGSVRWYRLIKPGREYKRTEYERELTRRADISTSPDGRYMALRLAPVWEEEPSVGSPPWDNSDATIGKKSQTIVVLSAESGEVVRTMQTDHNVLAQALTNNALIVETSPFSHLDEGTISSYYLDGRNHLLLFPGCPRGTAQQLAGHRLARQLHRRQRCPVTTQRQLLLPREPVPR